MSVLSNLKPENVFSFFEKICSIPHGSYHTKEISDYLVSFAMERNLEYYQDDMDNIVIIKEAAKGYENCEPVIIQGHMDMVCEREAGVSIDFLKDGLKLYIDGDFVKAEGTTLGGDDGIAVAFALALLDSSKLEHPRLEVVLTTNEEVGLLGAQEIDLSMLKGHTLLNIDSDVEGHFLTSCAGGLTSHITIPVSFQNAEGSLYECRLSNLAGGHSGSEIDKERANAILLMGRILRYFDENTQIGLAFLSGGLKDNAIPREALAKLVIPSENEGLLMELAGKIQAMLQKEYAGSDPDITLSLKKSAEGEHKILTRSAMQKVLFCLRNLPNGICHMSTNIRGLVETSLNAGIMQLREKEFYLSHSIRSSVSTRKEELLDRLTYLAEFLGGSVEVQGDYTAWEYRTESPLREKVKEVYKELFHQEPVFEAIHAGLECGILSDKITDLDAVSFGPDNFDIHTPKERLSISSTARVWEFLVEFLRRQK